MDKYINTIINTIIEHNYSKYHIETDTIIAQKHKDFNNEKGQKSA